MGANILFPHGNQGQENEWVATSESQREGGREREEAGSEGGVAEGERGKNSNHTPLGDYLTFRTWLWRSCCIDL